MYWLADLADLAHASSDNPYRPAAAQLQNGLQTQAILMAAAPGWRVWRIWRQNQSLTCSAATGPQKNQFAKTTLLALLTLQHNVRAANRQTPVQL